MSRIVVIGGHGRTGRSLVEKLLAHGDTVVATIRNPDHMAELAKLGAESIVLDLEKSDMDQFANSFEGADAVVFAAGSGENEDSAIDRKGTLKTVHAAEKAGVKRYVAISALGSSTPVPDAFDTPDMKSYYAAKRAGDKRIRASSLGWTILEPGELTEGNGTGRIAIGENGIDNAKIPREDVAAMVLAVLADPKSIGHTYQIVGGDTPIKDALQQLAGKSRSRK